MWHAAHPQTSTHPARRPVPPSPNQSLAKHNRKPSQMIENKQQHPKSIASFCRLSRNCEGKAPQLKSLSAHSGVFVGLALVHPEILPVAGSKGHDINATKLVRLQPLKYGFEVVA